MMIEGVGGIRLWLDDDGVNEKAVELFPEKGKEAETQMFEIRMWRLGHGSGNQGCRAEVRILSIRRGTGTKS